MTHRIRAIASVLVAAALLAAPLSLAAPGRAWAGEGMDPNDPRFMPMSSILSDFGFSAASINTVAGAVRTYPEPNYFHPTGQTPGISVSSIHIAYAATFEMMLTPEQAAEHFGPGGMQACGMPFIYCSPERLNQGPADEYYVYVIHTATPVSPNPNARIEFGAAVFNSQPPGGGEARPWETNAFFPWDFFGGANQAFVMRSELGADWAAFSLAYEEPFTAGFSQVPTDVVYQVLDGQTLIGYLPGYEVTGLQSARAFSFWAQNGSTDPANSAAMTSPPIDEPMRPVSGVPVISTATTPSVEPAPASAAPGTSAPPTTTPPTGEIDPATVLILAAGVALLALGGWFFLWGKKGDPCEELKRAWMAAQLACDEAQRRARAARDEANQRQADADTERKEADEARTSRQEIERLLATLREGPDHGTDYAEGDYKGKRLRIDEYDRVLREEAYAKANAQYGARLGAATDLAGRNAAHQQWQDELNEIGEPDHIEELREKDKGRRAERIKETEAELETARAAEAKAEGEAADAAAAAKTADAAADQAEALAAEVCARAAAAEKAYRDKCDKAAPPAGGGQGEGPAPGGGEGQGPGGGTPGEGGTPGGGPPPGGTPPPVPGGGTPPPPPPKPEEPPGKECPDGAEEWRPYGAKRIFLVPRPGAKIQIERTVALDELDEWLRQWDGLDAQGHPNAEAGAGVPPLIFTRMDQTRRDQLFRGVQPTRNEQIITFVLPLQPVSVQCERKWECRNGHWVQANECRATEVIGPAEDKRFEIKGNALLPNQVNVLARQALNAWNAAVDADKLRKEAGEACDRCK